MAIHNSTNPITGVPTPICNGKVNDLGDYLELCFRHYQLLPAYFFDTPFYYPSEPHRYFEVHKFSVQFAKYFREELELKSGDRIAIMLPNAAIQIYAFYGALLAGCTVVLIEPDLPPAKLKYCLLDSEARCIVTLERQALKIKPFLKKSHLIAGLFAFEGEERGYIGDKIKVKVIDNQFNKIDYRKDFMRADDLSRVLAKSVLVDTLAPITQYATSDLAALLYYDFQSHEQPIASVLTHRNLLDNVYQLQSNLKPFQKKAEGIFCTMLSLSHPFSMLFHALVLFGFGIPSVIVDHQKPKTIAKAFKKFPISGILGNNNVFQKLLTNQHFQNLKFKSLILALNTDNKIDKQLNHDWHNQFHKKINHLYLLPNQAIAITMQPFQNKNESSLGKALKNTELAIVDDESMMLEPDNVGNLCIKGPQVGQQVWHVGEVPHPSIVEGWMMTDIKAKLSENGDLFLVDA